MKTIIVPLDFSETSFNAAHYAAKMFANDTNATLILYHFYSEGEDVSVANNYLTSLRNELLSDCSKIETISESGDDFIDSLSAFAHVRSAYMIIMGLTGKSVLSQYFSGSNTLKMSEKNVCPVLIIPADARYNGVKNVLIASEMRMIDETPVLLAVKRVLHDFKPSLHILNVDESHYISLTKEFKEERDKMEGLLAEFNPEFYFMRLFDFHESINLFVNDKNIDMIIIEPKHHSFYQKLFKTMHTKKMIYQSKVPVLAVHE
ncbi:MAG: universal stress protein [Bacteroidetes bacterium]|nr:universal stress protein [Bacteroidota bacterium]MBS1756651.1 universal stress protein [Bacteroidota bacterium]